MTDIQIKTLVGLIVVVLAIVLIVQGHPIAPGALWSAFSYVVASVAFGLLLWDRWLWSWRVFRPWLTTRPDLRGTWKGTLQSNWVDPVTNQSRGAIDIYLVIRQTYSKVDVRLFSAESSSVSLSSNIFADNAGLYTLAITFRNTPTVLRRTGSPISHGGMLLYVRGTPIHQLDGEYWTDRSTKGELMFSAKTAAISHDFGQATRLTYDPLSR